MKSLSIVGLLLSVSSLGACASTTKSAESPWLAAAPELQEKIDRKAASLAYTPGLEERVELITWFARVGEPAYDRLLPLTEDPRPDVAGAALAALGATRDTRLVTYLQGGNPDEAESVRFERARALLLLGDWSGVPVMIEGLRSEQSYIRAVCHRTLETAVRETFGYDPRAEVEAREASIERWEAWWVSRAHDSLLEASQQTE